jgi:hypothetical protein
MYALCHSILLVYSTISVSPHHPCNDYKSSCNHRTAHTAPSHARFEHVSPPLQCLLQTIQKREVLHATALQTAVLAAKRGQRRPCIAVQHTAAFMCSDYTAAPAQIKIMRNKHHHSPWHHLRGVKPAWASSTRPMGPDAASAQS